MYISIQRTCLFRGTIEKSLQTTHWESEGIKL